MQTRTGIGQDSHAFENSPGKKLLLGGVEFESEAGLRGNSDSDVVLHALCNAISGVTAINVLGKTADEMADKGITDSKEYVKKALEALDDWKIGHVSFSIEAKMPKISPKLEEMRASIGELLGLPPGAVGITATTGEELSGPGQGKGIYCTAIITVRKPDSGGQATPAGV